MPDLAAKIRSALDEYDREADAERLEQRLESIEESAGHSFTKDELKRILGELDDDDRDEIVAALVGPERFERMRGGEPPVDEPPVDEPPVDEPPARRTRPGRKSSMAYDWDVDEQGNVVELDVARIYSGEDEPDEVELPADAVVERDKPAA